MNARRCAHGVRGRAKLLMTISTELKKLLNTWLIKYQIWSTYLWSPLLFVCGDVRVESNRSCMERRSGAPCFLYAMMHVLKVIESVWSVD
jgi:hypothetical protein